MLQNERMGSPGATCIVQYPLIRLPVLEEGKSPMDIPQRHTGASDMLKHRTWTRFVLSGCFTLLFVTFLCAAPIEWRSPGVGSAAGQPDSISTLNQPGTMHRVMQFSKVPTEHARESLRANGIELLRYLGSNSYFAAVRGGPAAAASATAHQVISAAAIERAWKLHPDLLSRQFPAFSVFDVPGMQLSGDKIDRSENSTETVVALYAVFHPDVRLERIAVPTVARHRGVVRDRMRSINALVIWIPLPELEALADEDVVEWLEPPLPPLDVVNDSNRVITQTNTVQQAPYNLSGAGINVLVYDGGRAHAFHADFAGRLTGRDTSPMHYHPTHVSGTIGGSGASSAANGGTANQWRGMAPAVTMQSYGFEYDGTGTFLYTNPGDLEADYNEAINTYGAVISNNSIGTNTAANGFPCAYEGDYGATDMLIDSIVRGSLGSPMRIIWANGNERGSGRCGTTYTTTAPPACAKNHITVGAVNSNDDSITGFTSWGPTDDGRMKPDVSAPGCEVGGDGGVTSAISGGYYALCGTSMAAPTVTGICALLLQDWKAQFPDSPLPPNAMLKVLLAHNAQDRGNAGPDYQFGYGSVRAQATVDFLRLGSLKQNSISQGQQQDILVYVPNGPGTLKVTLAWDDPAGAANTTPELVNDLDLVAISPSNVTNYPWTLNPASPATAAVRTTVDRRNNIEQVLVSNPAGGVWTIRVTGFSVAQGPQPYSIASSPLMQNCSSAGTIALNASTYSCSATVGVNVVDCDLNTNNATVQTLNVNVSSTNEPAGESIVLTETSSGSAKFSGSITVSTTNSPGVLHATNGANITATYNDANNGSGAAVVTDTATLDCIGPVISNVQITSVTNTQATITFATNEPATSQARYGTNCGALGSTSAQYSVITNHSLLVSGLSQLTTYTLAVDATDVAGNTTTANNSGSCYTFTTLATPDSFTEWFSSGENDISNRTLTFTPDNSVAGYTVCSAAASAFPTDYSTGEQWALEDDGFSANWTTFNLLDGKQIVLYGNSYSSVNVSDNGHLTFGWGDNSWFEGFDTHFSEPRISMLFRDLSTFDGGLWWQQLADRAVVTFVDVPELFTINDLPTLVGSNNFQCELFYNGVIRMTWLDLTCRAGLVGLSRGEGIPPGFIESDFSAYASCVPPDVNVTPPALTFNLQPGTSGTQNLTIQNTATAGADQLSYNLALTPIPSGTETVGAEWIVASGTNRYRGNTFLASQNRTLTLIESRLNFTGSASLNFVVYESTTLNGTYSRIHTQTVTRTGSGDAFYASNPLSVSLVSGRYYIIAVGWGASYTVSYSVDGNTTVLPVNFGTRQNGFLVDATYPLPVSTTNAVASYSYVQRLTTTGGGWLSTNVRSGAAGTGAGSVISVSANTAGLANGSYNGNIAVTTNDPDESFLNIPVTLNAQVPAQLSQFVLE
ncbi:MAG: S8 family serine peptidase [Candidatus Sumerlaeaceae bacterium]